MTDTTDTTDAVDSDVSEDATESDTDSGATDDSKPDNAGGKDWKSEASKWKALARKHETAAKSNADKATKFDETEAKNKTEAQKLADGKAKAEKDAAEARAETARLTAAVKHGLTEDDLELLGTGTPEEIEDRAAKLAKRIKAASPKPDFGGGNRGGDINGVKQWSQTDLQGKTTSEINDARKAGHLDRLMGKTK